MFRGFTNSHQNDSQKPSFLHPFWIPDPPKGGKCRHINITLKRLPNKYRKRAKMTAKIDGFFDANCIFISTVCLGKLDFGKKRWSLTRKAPKSGGLAPQNIIYVVPQVPKTQPFGLSAWSRVHPIVYKRLLTKTVGNKHFHCAFCCRHPTHLADLLSMSHLAPLRLAKLAFYFLRTTVLLFLITTNTLGAPPRPKAWWPPAQHEPPGAAKTSQTSWSPQGKATTPDETNLTQP